MTNLNKAAFTDDALDRKKLAEGIYKLLEGLPKGVVEIGVLGRPGSGRTWRP